MTEVVVLSDSNDSILSIENDEFRNVNVENEKKSPLDDSDLNDFDFPEVHFYHAVDADETADLQHDANKNCPTNNVSPCKSKEVCALSYESDNRLPTTSKNLKRHNVKKHSCSMSDSSDSAKDVDEANRKKNKQKTMKIAAKKSKSQLTEERLKRQEQLTREKALKAIALKKSKNIKPGECMKFIEVVLDKGIENFGFFTDITSTLLDANVQYSINTELIPNSITWKRSIENSYINETNEICTMTNIHKIEQILIIWNWDEVVTKAADDSLCTTASSIKALLPDYNVILVIFGIEDYFTYRKQTKSSTKTGTKNKTQKTNNKNNCEYRNFPEISRQQLEMCLNEIQITTKCSSRLLNDSRELALMVYQCTKAIAEIPYKLEKNKNITNKFDWYVMGDNKNTVRVDKDGNGLKRLWQQQLSQFNLSSLEIAEAICSVYPCPADLMEAYNNCTQDEGISLLRNIPIRRAAGPLTATRKVGPELSKKMYTMFTSRDGESVLS